MTNNTEEKKLHANINIYGNCAKEFYDNYYNNIAQKNSLQNYTFVDLSDGNIPNDDALISVIIPTYNRRKMLLKAINSVLNQTYKNTEIIIINDCSTDDTKKHVSSLLNKYINIKLINNETNMDAGYNRNLGYNEAKGQYIVFLDDDDYYIDYKFFSKAVAIHEKYKNLSFVGANAFIENSKEKTLKIHNMNYKGLLDHSLYINNFQSLYDKPISTFTAVFNKNALDQLDFQNMFMMNDSSIYLRALLLNDAYLMEDIIGVYVIHEKNISKRLDTKFIIANLDEKNWISKQAEMRAIFLDRLWLAKQTIPTIELFISGRKVSFRNLLDVFRWINRNIKYKRIYIIIEIIKKYVKEKVKKIIY